ncbi:P-type conjugative transfer protein TrbJ [Nostoc sp. 3335mG]|nr:P-type conjugative transfer protein TrbJ [Nostoc sp. 3335mG]
MTKGRFSSRILATAMVTCLGLASAGPADALLPVFDSSNFGQNLLTAERTLTQINNQIKALQNQATMLSNMARNLTTFNFPELQQITGTLQKVDTLMGQAQGISFKVSQLDAQFKQLFPGQGGTATTTDQQLANAKARLDTVMAAYRQTMATQSQIAENVTTDAANLSSLADRSQSSEGALQAAQATNQLLALTAKQQFQIQQMMAVQYRAEATDATARAQASIDAQAATKAFLGSGSAYTPR